MDFTGKAKKYIGERLAQKGLTNNSKSRGARKVPTMQQLQRNMREDQSKPTASSPYANTVKAADDPKYKSKFQWLFDPTKGVQWDHNPVQLRDLGQTDAWVQMLVNSMTTEMANMPWQIVEDDNPEVAKNYNPFQRVAKGFTGKQDATRTDVRQATQFFQQPNPDEDFSTFTEQIMADYLEVGSLAIPKVFTEGDYQGDELVSENPTLVHAKPSDPVVWTKEYRNKTGIISGYWQYDDANNNRQRINETRAGRAEPIRFDRKEVAWKDINPRTNRRYGLPPTLAVRDFLMLIDLTVSQEQDYWSRGAFPAGFISSDGDINEIEMLKDEAQSEQGRQGGIMHISDPDADFVKMANNWQEMQVTEREKWYAQVISSEFQVPTSVVGLESEDLNRATFEAERDNFESNTLGPYLHDLERLFTQEFVKPFFGQDLRFEFVPGMSENQKKEISNRVNTEFQNNLITRNEARQQLGYDSLEDAEDGFQEDVTEESQQSPFEQIQQSTLKDDFEDPCQQGYTMVGTKMQNGQEVPNCVPDEDVPEAEKQECPCKEDVGKPFGPWEGFDDCVSHMQNEQGYDEETAQRVCGSLQAELKDEDFEGMSKSEAKLKVEKTIEKILVEKQDSYTDYPDAASENAQMALDAKEDTGDPNDCGTRTGWARANQLADREPISRDTIERMSQFARHRDNSEQGEEDRADCGWMMWKAWGGDEGIEWAEDKVDELEAEDNEEKYCDQCSKDISKSDNKRFCSKKCYNKFLSKEDDDEPLRSDDEYFKYDFQPRHVEQFKEELQQPINQSLKAIFQDDRFNQLVERFAQVEQQDNSMIEKNSAELRRVLNELIKDAAMTDAMDQIIQDQSTSIAVTALQDQIADTGLDADIDEVTQRLENRNLNFVENFSQRMEEEIRDTVSTGWQQGQSIQEIQENLQEKADDLSDYQAERIARDQLQRSTGEARNEFAKQHSDKFVETWNAVGDDRTRPAHNEMDGSWKRPEEEFLVPYERAQGTVKENYPGESKYGIQCRCRTDLVPIDSVSESMHRGE